MTKLPFARLARHAYLDVIGNLRGLVRVGGLWLALGWALFLLGQQGSAFFGAVADVVMTLAVAAIAVMWHRHILLGEPLTAFMAPLDRRVARYFLLTVLLAVIISLGPLLALMLMGGLGAAGGEGAAGGGVILLPLALLVCLYIALRLQLIFPATAVADAAMTWRRSWALTRGNGLQLFLGFLITTLPVALVAVGLMLVLGSAAESTGSVALAALGGLVAVANAWLQAPLIASFLSYAYIFFQEAGPADGAVVPGQARP